MKESLAKTYQRIIRAIIPLQRNLIDKSDPKILPLCNSEILYYFRIGRILDYLIKKQYKRMHINDDNSFIYTSVSITHLTNTEEKNSYRFGNFEVAFLVYQQPNTILYGIGKWCHSRNSTKLDKLWITGWRNEETA